MLEEDDGFEIVSNPAQYLIRDPVERARLAAMSQSRVLAFLREELYSTTAILATVIDRGARQARNILARLERNGFIVRDEVRFMGRKAIPLWGITFEGIMEGLQTPAQVATASLRPHKVGSVKVPTLEHTLAIQECRAWYSNEGEFMQWTMENKLPCRHLPTRDNYRWRHYPDAVMQVQLNKKWYDIAIEVELNHKSQPRYGQIIRAHYLNVEQKRYHRIWYFCRTQERADKLAALFLRIAKEQKIVYWREEKPFTVEQSMALFVFKSLQDVGEIVF